jgi:hypothetical protein
MPHAEDAERAILGALLIDNELRKHLETLGPSDFFLDSHRRIFRAMQELEQIDIITVPAQLAKRGEVEAVGGKDYIYSLTELLPRGMNISNYVRTLKEKAALREVIKNCTAVISEACEQGTEPEQLSVKLETALQHSTQWRPEPSTSGYFVGALTFANTYPDEIDWAIEQIVPKGWNGLIIAEPKSLKSYSAVDMLISLSLGLPWLGFRVPRQIKTAILAREDYHGLTAWRISHFLRGKLDDFPGARVAEIDDWMYVNTRAQTPTFSLQNPNDLRTLIANLKARHCEFLMMDVFRKLHSANENDASEMQVVMDNVTRIQQEVGCAIGIVHHTNKAEGPIFSRSRGSSAIHGWMEWGIALSTVNPEEPPRNQVRKMEFLTKAGKEPDPIHVRSIECANWIKLEPGEIKEKPRKSK